MEANTWINNRKIGMAFYVLTFLTLAFFYFPNFFSGFTFLDDDSLINIPQLRLPFSLKLLKVLFTPGYHIDFYPLRDLSYWLDINVFQSYPPNADIVEFSTDPFRFHNFFLFLLCGAGLLALLTELGINPGIANLITCAWLINPFHYEMVAWISSRKDLMATLFMIWSTVCWLRFNKGGFHRWALLSLLLFACSLLSKATYVFIPMATTLIYMVNKELKGKRAYLLISILMSVGWAFLQKWHYTHVVDVTFNYPVSYRIQASLAALGRMSLGTVFPEFNTVDTYNWGEWLTLNRRFIWFGLLVWVFLIAFAAAIRHRPKRLIYLVYFFATYLPTSGLIFKHVNFYSVRYLEAPLLVATIGIAFFAQGRFLGETKKKILLVFCVLFMWFAWGLSTEKRNWSTNLNILHKAMALTPGSPGLLTLYLLRLKEVSIYEKEGGEIHKLITSVERNLDRLCLPATQQAPTGATSLCFLYIVRGYLPQPPKTKLTTKQVTEKLLELEGQYLMASKGFTHQEVETFQWARKVLYFGQRTPPPTQKYFPTEAQRVEWLAALKTIDPKSKEAENLFKEWEQLGLLFSQ